MDLHFCRKEKNNIPHIPTPIDAKQYINKMRTRDPELGLFLGTICPPVEMRAFDGKRRKVLKGRLIKEGNETVTNCYQLKLQEMKP